MLAGATTSFAQTPQPPSLVPPSGAPMSLAEYQGLSCAGVGVAVGLGALAYLDPITIAATGSFSSPLLLLPVAAAGFAVGCSVGATLSPAFLWFYRQGR